MLMRSTSAATFPSVQLHPDGGGLPIEVTLIARLERGSGDRLIDGVSARQRVHASFVDALDEPSARIGGIDLANGDVTSLYTFAVGKNGHPFHRHAGHRVFTAVSGGAGTRLRFSTASTGQLHRDPHAFLATLHHVDVPPDSMFVVRFGGGVWHQFIPLRPGTAHPALFALSCHTNELGGDLEPDLRRRVLRGAASIPAMTELLPTAVCALLESPTFDAASVPTTTLSLCERRPMWWRRSLHESPRWLETRGRHEEAKAVVADIEREVERSGVVLAPVTLVPSSAVVQPQGSFFGNLKALWRPPLARTTLMTWCLWLSVTFCSYAFFVWIPGLLVQHGMTVTKSFSVSILIYLAQIPGYYSAAFLRPQSNWALTIPREVWPELSPQMLTWLGLEALGNRAFSKGFILPAEAAQ